jgi:hypothetical protein
MMDKGKKVFAQLMETNVYTCSGGGIGTREDFV